MKLSFASTNLVLGALALGLLATQGPVAAADLSLPLTGNLLGVVTDPAGTPQMGATVQLLNKYERVIAKAITSPDGRFAFAALPIDVYSVRVSLATFLPAARDKIAIRPGANSMLRIHMATLLSSIEVNYAVPTAAMTDDWKWVLRSSPATRPITRFLPELASDSGTKLKPRVFSGTHAMLSVSGGDGGLVDTDSTQADFGTGFALSTNLFGKNQIQLGGAFGQNGAIGPSAMGLCAIYSRNQNSPLAATPEITLTMSQLGSLGPVLPGSQVAGSTSGFGNMPILRAMSLGMYEVADPFDGMHIEYGMTGETVDYLQHTSRISPFARLTISDGIGTLVLAYSDGGRPDELTAHGKQSIADLENDGSDLADAIGALSRLPQLSERNGRLELQRTQSYEAGYRRAQGSITYAVSGFYEDVSNGRINVAGDLSPLNALDVLSDGISTTSTYNVGNYRRDGYIASADDRLSDHLDVALAYGRMGGFIADSGAIAQGLNAQQHFLSQDDHNIAATNVSGKIPGTGTMFVASYGWVDSGTIVPRHVFTTQNVYVSPGLNIDIRQPLPSIFGMPGRMEITADLRNLLAQGYIPMPEGSGTPLLIVQAPRAIRGGLNFIF